MDNQESNIFIRNKKYKDVKNIFSTSIPDINTIKDTCFFVLDTNVLLKPYDTKTEDLNAIKNVYKKLTSENRLFIPRQVAREFVDNRPNKIRTIHQTLTRHQDSINKLSKSKFLEFDYVKYPLLSDMNEFNELSSLEEELNQKAKIITDKLKEDINDYNSLLDKYQKKFDSFKKKVEKWNWRDPISLIYAELFNEKTIIELDFKYRTQEFLEKELRERSTFKIPPGYKDSSKEDKGIGDLIIWFTILQMAYEYNKDIVFVGGDEKGDWFVQGEGKALYPRFELISEFKDFAPSKSFSIIRFSEFLELFKAPSITIERIENSTSIENNNQDFHKRAELAVIDWLLNTSEGYKIEIQSENRFPDILLHDENGLLGIEVMAITRLVFWDITLSTLRRALTNLESGRFSNFSLIIVVPDTFPGPNLQRLIGICRRELSNAVEHRDHINITVGSLNPSNEFIEIETIS